MRLELADYPVAEARLGGVFRYEAGKLEVDRRELADLVSEDSRIEDVSLAVVHPGEKTRITGIRDIVEPRIKSPGDGQVFPGTLSPVKAAGTGRTQRLSGVAVIATAAYEGTARAGLAVQRSAILDMWGAGAEASRFSSLVGLVLIMKLRQGLSDLDAHSAIQSAELKVARRIAETTVGLPPPRLDVFDLGQCAQSLPRVVLIQGCLTDSHNIHSGLSYYACLFATRWRL